MTNSDSVEFITTTVIEIRDIPEDLVIDLKQFYGLPSPLNTTYRGNKGFMETLKEIYGCAMVPAALELIIKPLQQEASKNGNLDIS